MSSACPGRMRPRNCLGRGVIICREAVAGLIQSQPPRGDRHRSPRRGALAGSARHRRLRCEFAALYHFNGFRSIGWS